MNQFEQQDDDQDFLYNTADFDSAWDQFMKEQLASQPQQPESDAHTQDQLLKDEETNAFSRFLDNLMQDETSPKQVLMELDRELHRLGTTDYGNENDHDPRMHEYEVYEQDKSVDSQESLQSDGRKMNTSMHSTQPAEHVQADRSTERSTEHVSIDRPIERPIEHVPIEPAQRDPVPIDSIRRPADSMSLQRPTDPIVIDPVPIQRPTESIQRHNTSPNEHSIEHHPPAQVPDNTQYQYVYPTPHYYTEYPIGYNPVPIAPKKSRLLDVKEIVNPQKRNRRKRQRDPEDVETSRVNHVHNEQKRRNNIRDLYNKMCKLVPEVSKANVNLPKRMVLELTYHRVVHLMEENRKLKGLIEAKTKVSTDET